MTMYDQYYGGKEEEELKMEEVQQHVRKHLKDKIEINVEEKQIVPVCGQWALTARQLKNNCEEEGLLSDARDYLEKFMRRNPCGQNVRIHDLKNLSVATDLEEASNICQLEERLVI